MSQLYEIATELNKKIINSLGRTHVILHSCIRKPYYFAGMTFL